MRNSEKKQARMRAHCPSEKAKRKTKSEMKNKMNEKLEMNPSRRSATKLVAMLNAAEQGGMSPPDCGSIYEAMTACWSGLNAEQITKLNNSLTEIESIPDGNEFDLGAYVSIGD